MLPIMLDIARAPVLVVGNGALAIRRLTALEEAGAKAISVFAPEPEDALVKRAGARLRKGLPGKDALAQARLVFLAGVAPDLAAEIVAVARRLQVLVNVEDVAELCDFYMPALVRRGDLSIAVSTAGRSPGLAKRIRGHIGGMFGKEWEERLAQLSAERERWRSEGLSGHEVAERTDRVIDENGWLK